MECIYCAGSTAVTNSRPNQKQLRVWRRRQCKACEAVFTTIEAPELGSSLVVNNKGELSPFSRDLLLISIYQACGHRPNAASAASELASTIISKLIRSSESAEVDITDIQRVTLDTLKHFDKAAASHYKAYHPLT